MLQIIDNQELLGEYADFNIAILVHKKQRGEEFVVSNKKFQELFLPNKESKSSLELFSQKLMQHIIDGQEFYWKGNCYKVNKLTKGHGHQLYFISSSNDSMSQSFLWLKHDLLNIINPIMGFSDILLESNDIASDELELIGKINSNAGKLYHEINQISLFHNINKAGYKLKIEEYDLNSFLNELADKLIINNHIESHQIRIKPCKNHIFAKMASHEFRQILENQLIIFSRWQEHPQIDISSNINRRSIQLNIQFDNCIIPPNKMKDITKIIQLISTCEYIDKIQIEGFNYLILFNILELMDGDLYLALHENNSCTLQITLPIIKNSSIGSQQLISNNKTGNDSGSRKPQIAIPLSLEQQLRGLCSNFDGLLILDEWEDMATKIENINSAYRVLEIQQIVDEIRTAVRTYQVDKLKKIYQHCHFLFE